MIFVIKEVGSYSFRGDEFFVCKDKVRDYLGVSLYAACDLHIYTVPKKDRVEVHQIGMPEDVSVGIRRREDHLYINGDLVYCDVSVVKLYNRLRKKHKKNKFYVEAKLT